MVLSSDRLWPAGDVKKGAGCRNSLRSAGHVGGRPRPAAAFPGSRSLTPQSAVVPGGEGRRCPLVVCHVALGLPPLVGGGDGALDSGYRRVADAGAGRWPGAVLRATDAGVSCAPDPRSVASCPRPDGAGARGGRFVPGAALRSRMVRGAGWECPGDLACAGAFAARFRLRSATRPAPPRARRRG